MGLPAVSVVYASRHGELGRTVELLSGLASGEDLSPTTFSLSVLNSAAGIFSIARGNHAPATAVSAGCETFGFGLVEAFTRLRGNPDTPLLYVYADAPMPALLGSQRHDPEDVFAFAMLLGGCELQTVMDVTMGGGDAIADKEPQVLACLRALNEGVGHWSSGGRQWSWRVWQ